MVLYLQPRSGSSEVPLVPPRCSFEPRSLSPSRSASLVVATRYARATTTNTIAPGLSLSAPLRTQAPRRHLPSPIALWSRHLVRRVRCAHPSPSCRHYFTWVPLVTHDSSFAPHPYVIIIRHYISHPPRSCLAGGIQI